MEPGPRDDRPSAITCRIDPLLGWLLNDLVHAVNSRLDVDAGSERIVIDSGSDRTTLTATFSWETNEE